MTAPDTPQPALPRWRRWLTPINVVTLAVALYLGPRLLPHLGAIVGVESGAHDQPIFRAQQLDGLAVSTESLRGRVVLVNFWATWCLPCRVEMPLLQAMANRHAPDGLVVLGLSVDRAPETEVRRFLTERDITYPVAVVGRDVEQVFGGIVGYPTSILLDRTGRVRYKVVGPLAMATLEPAVRRLLADTASR